MEFTKHGAGQSITIGKPASRVTSSVTLPTDLETDLEAEFDITGCPC